MADLKLGNIKPVGADNVVVESKYIKGSYVVVSSREEMNSLVTDGKEVIIEGSLCYCSANDEKKFYQYLNNDWKEVDWKDLAGVPAMEVSNETLIINF